MSFGEEIKRIRTEELQITLDQLSEDSGLSKGFISKLENNKQDISRVENIKKLAKGLKVDYLQLLQKAGYLDEAEKWKRRTRIGAKLNKATSEENNNKKNKDYILNKDLFVNTLDPQRQITLPGYFKLDGEMKKFDNNDFFTLYNLINIAIDKNDYLPFTNIKGEKIDVEELKKLLPIIKSLYN